MNYSHSFLCCFLLFSLSLFHTGIGIECWNGCSYQCWNAVSFNVTSPSHFLIDPVHENIILTALNSVCHISLDLTTVNNVKNVTPDANTLTYCTGHPLYNDRVLCHNFHHILLLPFSPGNDIMMVADSNTPLSDTILECGSNAFKPQCNYRMRSTLNSISTVEGGDYIPNDGGNGDTTSLWLSSGRLVSASPLNAMDGFGIAMSNTPYDGSVHVGTVSGWFDRSVRFVSMYEIDEYMYTFFTEDPNEIDQNSPIIYSRVSRVCKNDVGVYDSINPVALNHNIFTTFLKARMTCVSRGNSGELPYYYNQLQDTFLTESERSDGSLERNLYAVFNAPLNGPEGSAVCVYSFDEDNSEDEEEDEVTLDTVFDGDYLQETGLNQFESTNNPTPFTCSSERTAQEANQLHLMADTVHQTHQDTLHVQLTGYTLKKILIARVRDVGGVSHDVMYMAGSKAGRPVLLKTIYDSIEEKHYIISELELKLTENEQVNDEEPIEITHMQFLGNGSHSNDSLYIGTTDAIYKVPVASCEQFTEDCCGCISLRDPHCVYDTSNDICIGIDDDQTSSFDANIIQNVADGDIGVCTTPPGSGGGVTPSPATPTPVVIATTDDSSNSVVVATQTPDISEPGGLGGDGATEDYRGTIMGSVFGFVGGMFLGIIAAAFCYMHRGRFVWSKYISSSSRPTVQQETRTTSDKGATNRVQSTASAAASCKDYERNNSEMNPHSNATNIVHVHPISNLSHSGYPRSKGKRGSNDTTVISPPPYSEKNPTQLPSNAATMTMTSSEISDEKVVATPTKERVQSTPEHKLNKTPPTNHTPSSSPGDHGNKTPPKPLVLSLTQPTPSTLSQATPTDSSLIHSPLTLTLQAAYRRADSYNHAVNPNQNGYHSSTLPPPKKRHASTSQTTPTHRPTSAEAPPFRRPASAQNLNAATHGSRNRTVAMGTPNGKPRSQQPHSPFNATPSTPPRNGVPPASPYSGTSSGSTPISTCSGGSVGAQHFKFPQSKFPEGVSPSYQKSRLTKNPNVKATGVAVEPTTNQEREMYGPNMATRMHTIDRKSKLPNGHHSASPRQRLPSVTTPHPDTTVIEIDGGLIGCTDC